MSEDDTVYKVLEVMNDRMTDLSACYRVLNDNHHTLELKQIALETKLDTIWGVIKFLITPGIGLTILIELLRIAGVVK